MANVLVALDDEHEALLRKMAQKKYASKKGSISKIMSEALDELAEQEKRKKAKSRLIQKMEKGYNIGFKGYKKRSEIYD